MINKQSTLSSITLAAVAASRGMTIIPVSGTPVENLVTISNTIRSSVVALNEEEDVNIVLQGQAEFLSAATQSDGDLKSSHDLALDSYVNSISVYVRNHISFAKNIVSPAVISMANHLSASMQEVVLPASEFCVEMLELPLPMQSSAFETSIEKYEGKEFGLPSRELTLDAATPEEILEMLKTGSKDQDATITQWFASKPISFFNEIWNNLFRDFRVSAPSKVTKFQDFISDKDCGIECALTINLLARKLFDNIPENTGMSLDVYKNTVADYRDLAGKTLLTEYNRYNQAIRTGQLVIGAFTNRKIVRVNASVYRAWIKEGGSNEVLLGMLVTGKSVFTVNAINENAEEYLKAWNTYEQFTNTAAKNNSFNTFITNLKTAYFVSSKEVSQQEASVIAENSGCTENMAKYFEEELQKVTPADMKDVHEVCLRLVSRSRFFYTDAEKILRGINEAVKANPNIDIREAATLSAIEYISDYVSDQLRLV